MKTGEGLRNFDYNLWEYALVAHPGGDTYQKIIEEKKFFEQKHEHRLPLGQPHITIASFMAKEAMEDTLIRWIQNICNLQSSFQVTLHNYSGFPPHTIYLRVQDPKPFLHLANSLKIIDNFIQSNDCPPLFTVSRPHLSLAAGLSQGIYERAIREYAEKSFFESFRVDRLVLLKRDAFQKCSVVNTFTLPASA